jgi:hypothetical protein
MIVNDTSTHFHIARFLDRVGSCLPIQYASVLHGCELVHIPALQWNTAAENMALDALRL